MRGLMERFFRYVALVAVLAAFLVFFATQVWDVDFWWHIASGKNIVENKSLPSSDPFSVYNKISGKSETLLKCYWIGQIMLYGIVDNFGIDGIIFFRAVLLTICLTIILFRSEILGSPPEFALLVVILSGMTCMDFTGERPQLFSFVFAIMIFLLLDFYAKQGKRACLYLMPALMALWANCHGGVVLGAVLILLYTVTYWIERKCKGILYEDTGRRVFIVAGITSIVASLISPNGWNTYLMVLQIEGSDARQRISEYMTPYEVWRQTPNTAPYYYLIIMLMGVVSLYGLFRKKEVGKAAIIVFLGGISMTAYRYIPFFLFVAGPYIAFGLGCISKKRFAHRTALYLIISLAAIYIMGQGISKGSAFQRGFDEERFPVKAVGFIKQNGLKGRVFNTLGWGGYLLWNAYPNIQVYIDGRNLDRSKFYQYTHILWATGEGLAYFEHGHFDLVLIPKGNMFSGEAYPLNQYLLKNPNWRVLFADKRGYLFGRIN